MGDNLLSKNETYPMIRRIVTTGKGDYKIMKSSLLDLKDKYFTSSSVIVKVEATGLNFYDIYIQLGLGENSSTEPMPLGLECAGTVTEIGSEVSNFKKGDRVVVHCPEGGALSDVIVVNKDDVLHIPAGMDFIEAAALTINYLTAYFSLFHAGNLSDNQTVLIQGAAGGVGWAATQLTKLRNNVKVIGTASSGKHGFIEANGVHLALDYDSDLESCIEAFCPSGVSLILESMAGESFNKSQRLLAPFGKVVIIGAKNMVDKGRTNILRMFRTWWKTKNVSPYQLITGNYGVAGFHLNKLRLANPSLFRNVWVETFSLYLKQKIKPKIDSVISFDRVDMAFQKMTQRKNVGKIILVPGS